MAALTTARVQVLVWVLIYGGLLIAGVGFSLREVGAAWGVGVVGGGLVVATVGLLLIWVRSRMKADAAIPD